VFQRVAVTVGVACAAVAMAGCASAASTQAAANPVPAPAPLQLTGKGLSRALLPLSDFPAGYAIYPQGTSDSGSSLLSVSAPAASPRGCPQMGSATATPAGMTADAAETITGPAAAGVQRFYTQSIRQFATPSQAAQFAQSLRAASGCAARGAPGSGGVTATVSVAPPVAGHAAFLTRQDRTANGVTVSEAALETVDGAVLCSVGAAAIRVPAAVQPSYFAALTARLLARLHALSS
jgi:hypothetical protein